MKTPFFVEILSRSKEVRHRHRLDAVPIRIGRGYDNDIILDDPHIAEHHAVIEQDADGGLTIRDQGSRNGVVCSGLRKTKIALDGNTVFKLGHTHLRVRSSDFIVENEIPVSRFHNWEGWPPAVAGLSIIVILACLTTWMTSTDKQEATDYLLSIVIILGVGMIWSGSWAFANRLFGGNTRLGRHLLIFGSGFAAAMLWDLVGSALAYALSWEVITRYESHVLIAIIATIVFFHLKHISPYRVRYLGMSCIAISVIGSAIILVINYSSGNRFSDELYMSVRMPPALRLSADKPVATLITAAEKLKSQVDIARTKDVSDDEEDGHEKE